MEQVSCNLEYRLKIIPSTNFNYFVYNRRMFDVLAKAAHAGGKILLKYFRTTELDVIHKTDHQNIVTKADKESQKVIKEALIAEMKKKGVDEKDIGFIGEEDLVQKGKHTFVIDPLDGTSNFASGLDYFCIPIGYFKDNELLAGIIIRPTTNEIFYAEKGQGAYVMRKGRKEKLQMQKIDMRNAFILTEAWTKVREDKQMLMADQFLAETRGLRILGAIAIDIICLVENVATLIISDGPLIWDLAAGKIILEESGGGMYELDGSPIQLDLSSPKKHYALIACHPERKDEIVEKIAHFNAAWTSI